MEGLPELGSAVGPFSEVVGLSLDFLQRMGAVREPDRSVTAGLVGLYQGSWLETVGVDHQRWPSEAEGHAYFFID